MITEPELLNERLERLAMVLDEIMPNCANLVRDALSLLKEQEEKTGHWTTHRTLQHDGEWYCDKCDYEPTVFENTPFCPNCGASMRLDK